MWNTSGGQMRKSNIAAMKAGKSPAIQVGPRGGRFYVSDSGKKVYGEPPKGVTKIPASAIPWSTHMPYMYDRKTSYENAVAKAHQARAEGHQNILIAEKERWQHNDVKTAPRKQYEVFVPRAAKEKEVTPNPPKPKPRKDPPPHVVKGGHVKVDLGDEGHLPGVITHVYNGKARVKLSDGTFAVGSFDSFQPHDAAKPAKTVSKSKEKGQHAVGAHVRVEVEGEGWIRGTVKSNKGGVYTIDLHDGSGAVELSHEDAKTSVKARPRVDLRAHGLNVLSPQVAHDLEDVLNDHPAMAKAVKHLHGKYGEELLVSEVPEMGRAMGRYYPPPRSGGDPMLWVRPEGGFEERMKAGGDLIGHEGAWVVAAPGSNLSMFRQRTLLHELAHHVHMSPAHARSLTKAKDLKAAQQVSLNGDMIDMKVKTHHASIIRRGGWTPSQYARVDHREWFAEASVAYFLHGEKFKKEDPIGHELVERVYKRYEE